MDATDEKKEPENEQERNEAGEWEGHGIYRFSDGASYEGEWVANQQHGRGTMNYASAASYTGDWRAGMKHGTGTYLWADGRIEIGFYDHDRSVGEARSGQLPRTHTHTHATCGKLTPRAHRRRSRLRQCSLSLTTGRHVVGRSAVRLAHCR